MFMAFVKSSDVHVVHEVMIDEDSKLDEVQMIWRTSIHYVGYMPLIACLVLTS